MGKIEIIALNDFPEIKPNDDLSKIIFETAKKNNAQFEDFDILVIAHKIVSKSEGRIVNLENVIPSDEAYRLSHITGKDPKIIEVILSESREVVKALKGHLIVENVQGIVCANAGVDRSNVDEDKRLVLLPKDPDYSAKIICENLMRLTSKKLAVIISDTYGRMLREGQMDMAIGLYGIYPFKDYRGKCDMFGNVLQSKNIALADEIASAAELLIGQADEKIPVVIIRGLKYDINFESTAKLLNMKKDKWLFK